MQTRITASLILLLNSFFSTAQIPILNSAPSITDKVIYLDFDGHVAKGTSWNNGNTINAAPSTISNNNKIIVWKRVSEDYRPFDVNVTTDSTRFNNALPNKRMRVVITPTSAWYGSAGGVAFLGSFAWGGYPGTPCWVFENQLGYNAKNIAEAASHEAGHTLSLRHQSTYNASCTKTNEYNPGIGTGVTSWAPIMGVGYNKNVTIWHNGTNAQSCTTFQADHGTGGITGIPYLRFLPDDVGDTYNSAKILNLNSVNLADSGIITQPTDIDAYRFTICNTRNVTIAVKPWALDTTNYSGANLDVRLHLYTAAGALIAVDTSLTKLHTQVAASLAPGSYYFVVDGGRSNNYSDYGSLGKYYVAIKTTNPPLLTSSIITNPGICAGLTTTLNYISNGTPLNWLWTLEGPSTATYTSSNPSFAFNVAGIYTVNLLVSNASYTGCPVSTTLNIGALPNVSITASSPELCPGKNVTLTGSGALTYSWFPQLSSLGSIIVTPSQNTTYTLVGYNGTCSNSAVSSVSVVPDFTINATVANPSLCPGESTSINVTGATAYTILPGNITSVPAIVSPNNTTGFTIFGGVSSCVKSIVKTIIVSPPVFVNIMASDTMICAGETSTLTAYGSVNYTFEPGFVGNTNVVSPLVTTEYTVTAQNNFECSGEKVFTLTVLDCSGINENAMQAADLIYPNPAHNEVTVVANQNGELVVLNAIGEQVQAKTVQANTPLHLSTSEWAKGIYFLHVHKQNGVSDTYKLVVE